MAAENQTSHEGADFWLEVLGQSPDAMAGSEAQVAFVIRRRVEEPPVREALEPQHVPGDRVRQRWQGRPAAQDSTTLGVSQDPGSRKLGTRTGHALLRSGKQFLAKTS